MVSKKKIINTSILLANCVTQYLVFRGMTKLHCITMKRLHIFEIKIKNGELIFYFIQGSAFESQQQFDNKIKTSISKT